MSETTEDRRLVTTEDHDGILVVCLDQPEVLNSFGDQMLDELGEAFRFAHGEPSVRAVVLTGRGRAFCAGANLKTVWGRHSAIMSLRKRLNPVILAMADVEKAVIAAVNGVTAGAGLGFMGVCDYRIASNEAVFVPATTKIGVSPDGGMSYTLPRLIGPGRTFRWLSTGEHVDAATALSWGLVEEVVPPEQVLDSALALARACADAPELAVSLTKRLIRASDGNSLAEQLELEHRTQDLTSGPWGR